MWQLWVLMLASLAIAVPLAYLLNIRFDEAFTLNTTLEGPVDAAKRAVGFGQQAPFYFILISLWRMIDPSIFFARLFSVLLFPLIVWIAAEVSRRYVKDVNPLITAAIVVVHQQVVWNALDIRLYTLMTLLSGLLLLFFHDGFLSEKPEKRSQLLYTVVAVISIYTQYYLGFQLVAGAVILLVLGRWKMLVRYVVLMAIAGVAFIPMLIVMANGQMNAVTDQIDAPLPFSAIANALYQRIVAIFMSVNAIENESIRRWFARIAVVVIGLVFAAKLLRKRKAEDIALAVSGVVLTILFFVAYAAVGEQLVQQRHLSNLILPLILIPLSAMTVFRKRFPLWLWIVLVLGLNIGFLFIYYSPLAKPGDFERMANYVMANEKPGEPVLIFHADAILPFRFYYKGQNKMQALPQENGKDVWNPRNNVLHSEEQILNVINAQPGSPQKFWLVDDGWCVHGTLKFNCDLLESVISKNFVVEDEHRFLPPSTVRLLRRK